MCKQQPELEEYAEKFADAEKSGAQLPPGLMQRLAEVKERADLAAKVSFANPVQALFAPLLTLLANLPNCRRLLRQRQRCRQSNKCVI